jgi:hypothetical protein
MNKNKRRTYTPAELAAADLRRARLVAAVDAQAAAETAARAELAARRVAPVAAGVNDGPALLLAMVAAWGDEPSAEERRGRGRAAR